MLVAADDVPVPTLPKSSEVGDTVSCNTTAVPTSGTVAAEMPTAVQVREPFAVPADVGAKVRSSAHEPAAP
jgi:hypothetical protein